MSIDSFCLDYSIAVGSPALFFSSSSLFLFSCIVVSDFFSDFFLDLMTTIVVSPASRLIRKRCFLNFEFVSYFLWKVAICLGVLLIFLIFSFFFLVLGCFCFFVWPLGSLRRFNVWILALEKKVWSLNVSAGGFLYFLVVFNFWYSGFLHFFRIPIPNPILPDFP